MERQKQQRPCRPYIGQGNGQLLPGKQGRRAALLRHGLCFTAFGLRHRLRLRTGRLPFRYCRRQLYLHRRRRQTDIHRQCQPQGQHQPYKPECAGGYMPSGQSVPQKEHKHQHRGPWRHSGHRTRRRQQRTAHDFPPARRRISSSSAMSTCESPSSCTSAATRFLTELP